MSVLPNDYSLHITIDDAQTEPTWQLYSIGDLSFRAQVFGVVTVSENGVHSVVVYLGGCKNKFTILAS